MRHKVPHFTSYNLYREAGGMVECDLGASLKILERNGSLVVDGKFPEMHPCDLVKVVYMGKGRAQAGAIGCISGKMKVIPACRGSR